MRSRALVGAALGLCLPVCAWSELPRLVAARTSLPPRIDGRLTEPEWQAAFEATPFLLLGSAKPPTQTTIARVLYDAAHLYLGFDCRESDPDRMVRLVQDRDGTAYTDDCVEVFVAPGPAPGPYYHFVVNAAGVLRDECGQDPGWNSRAAAAAYPSPGGWSAELAVPLADLAIPAGAGSDWRLNLAREERPHGELSSWAPTQAGFHEPERFGWLTNLDINVARYARAELLRRLQGARAQVVPALERARQALPLTSAAAAVRHGDAAERSLGEATGLAAPQQASVADLQQAETALQNALGELATLQRLLPRVEMSVALQQQDVAREYAVCEETSMARIRPDRPYAGRPARSLSVSLAANEHEATQIVVVPLQQDLKGVRVSAGELRSTGGAVLPAQEVTVNLVGCVRVTEPSARSGAEPGLYPDPLLDEAPTDIARDSTAAWLITVHVPPGRPPGEYRGRVAIRPQNAPARELPLVVTVWGFELPPTSALRTCFQILPAYLWKHYNLPSAPGVPLGWESGVWTGADVEGRPDYFGRGIFRFLPETARPHSGKRAVCIEGQVAEPGTHEAPRACLHRLFAVQPGAEYEVRVWYRTEGLADGAARLDVHTHAAGLPLPAAADWAEARLRFAGGDQKEARVYLGNHGVGRVWFDDLSLAPVASPESNLLEDPGFEQGGAFEDRARLLRAYRLNSLAHRCSDMNVAAPEVQIGEDGRVRLDWTTFDEETALYRAHGLNAFNVHWARVPGGWGSVDGVDADTLRISGEILRQTQEHLQAEGWLELAYLYTIDEPGKDAFPAVEAAFAHVKRHAPGLKRLLTFGYGASRPMTPGRPLYRHLEGAIDIWVPHSDCFDAEYLDTRRRAGEEIWEYVCISAQKPYANVWGIDFPGSDPRVVFWQCYAERITGFLYWATTYWEKDPWQDPLTYPGGNGDGSLLYYGPSGPVNSLRWETIRDGIEDYDTLVLLQRLAERAQDERGGGEWPARARRALDVSPVTRSYTQYTASPETILRQRAGVARLAERLTAELGR